MKLRTNGIKFKLWLYFMLFSLIILCLLWFLQTVFINTYYKQMKEQSISAAADRVSALYAGTSGTELQTGLDEIANQSDVFIAILDSGGSALYSVNPVGRDFMTPVRTYMEGGRNAKPGGPVGSGLRADVVEQVFQNPDGAFIEYFRDVQNTPMLLYGKVVRSQSGETSALLVSSQLAPLNETVNILSNQLVIVTFIVLALGLGISLLIATRIARPIRRITGTAAKLAAGNYDVAFPAGSYDEIDQLASALNYAAEGLNKVETLRRELIANVSHDLRTPLTMIRAYAEMVRDISGDSAEKRDVHLQIIIEECERLAGLVENMMDVSKMQAGAAEFYPSDFDLTETIQSVLSRYALHAQHGYRFVFTQNAPAYVFADKKRVEQVLFNLLNNAVRHTGKDKTVFVSMEETESSVRVRVTDTGPGIQATDIDHIWDRYYKGSGGSAMNQGLGLSIVKAIMQMHGTAFGALNEPNGGATFWFELNRDTGEQPG